MGSWHTPCQWLRLACFSSFTMFGHSREFSTSASSPRHSRSIFHQPSPRFTKSTTSTASESTMSQLLRNLGPRIRLAMGSASLGLWVPTKISTVREISGFWRRRSACNFLIIMAPEVGLEPTTLRLTEAYWRLHSLTPRRTFVHCKRLTWIYGCTSLHQNASESKPNSHQNSH